MNVLGISETPRKGGNSERLLKAALTPFEKAGWATEKILLSQKHVEMCKGCETCAQTNSYPIDDDMQEIYSLYEWCDAIVIA